MTTITIKDVAREAKVSVASVSRALNGNRGVTDETGKRIREVAQRLKYVPHAAARSLITRRTHTIGALLPDLHGEFFSELIRGMDQAARAHGLHLLVSSSHEGAEDAAAALRAMQGRVDGMLILSGRVDEAFLQANLPPGTLAVLLNSAVQSEHYSTINVDSYSGAYAMVQHLLGLGYRDIALISGPEKNYDAQRRAAGYCEAMQTLAADAPLNIIAGDFTETSGYLAGQALLAQKRRTRAVFAANDMMALGCLQAFKEAGLDVPGDMALAGFDDVPIARYVTPALTTVHANIAELGRIALEHLAARLQDADQIAVAAQTLGCEVLTRQSCGARSPILPGGTANHSQQQVEAARGGES